MRFTAFRQLCLALPEAEEREIWGEATFRVRDRIFARLVADYELRDEASRSP